MLVVVLLAGFWALRHRDRRALATLVAVAIFTEALNVLLKLAFDDTSEGATVATFEARHFPSGAAMAAVAVYGTVATIAVQRHPRWAPVTVGVVVLVTLMLGLSRVALGIHWPTDMLAGFAAGSVLLAAALYVLTAGPRRRPWREESSSRSGKP